MKHFTKLEQAFVEDIMSRENSDLLMQEIILEYAKKSSKNALYLLDLIPAIAKQIMRRTADLVEKYSLATENLMHQVTIPVELGRASDKTKFASMVPVCMVKFPNGHTRDIVSGHDKAYFAQFLELMKNPKAFNWEHDAHWAVNFKYAEYLRLVEQENFGRETV